VRKIAVTVLALAATGASAQEQTKFEPLYRAAKKIQSADRESLNLLRFRQLVDDLSAEVSVAKDRASSAAEKDTVAAFEVARGDYGDFKALWEMELRFQGIVGTSSPIPCVPDCVAIADRHGLTATLPDHAKEVIARAADKKKAAANTKGPIYYIRDVMGPVFDIGDKDVAKATALYMGKKTDAK
jgi:hypothetical protein